MSDRIRVLTWTARRPTVGELCRWKDTARARWEYAYYQGYEFRHDGVGVYLFGEEPPYDGDTTLWTIVWPDHIETATIEWEDR